MQRLQVPLIAVFLLMPPALAVADEAADRIKQVAGKAELLRRVPKKFAMFLEATGTVRLQLEGDEAPTTWPVLPDAEIKIHGWWGRLDQLQQGDRVWVWLATDRRQQPNSVLMVADELSEQEIHANPAVLEAVDTAPVPSTATAARACSIRRRAAT